MDVHELRAAFLQSETVVDRVRNFRRERLGRIESGETPTVLGRGPKLVLHVIPLAAFGSGASILDQFSSNDLLQHLHPIWGASSHDHYTFDGWAVYSNLDSHQSAAYILLFRSNAIEATTSRGFTWEDEWIREGTEGAVRKAVGECCSFLTRAGVSSPFGVLLSLLNVKGYRMGHNSFPGRIPIDRDDLLCPEVRIEDASIDLSSALDPIFNSLWNACGEAGPPTR